MAIAGLNRLAGKVIVITGGAQGLGKALSQRFVDEGAKVVIGDLNEEGAAATAKEIGENAISKKVDVTDYDSVEDLIKFAVEKHGKIDVVVANAAVLFSGPIDEIDIKKFQLVVNVGMLGFFYTCRAAAIQFKKQGYGNVIQINSKSGKKGSYKNAAYAGTKFGGIGLVQSFALELAENNIRVNAICPGNLLNSPLWRDKLFKEYAKNQGITEEEVYQKYVNQVPMKRGCEFDDVANVAVFLASEESSYMTGQAINVTGGQQMMP